MSTFWEIYFVLCLSFSILSHLVVIPKIMKELASKMTFLQKFIHNTAFFIAAMVLMPFLSLLVLSDEDGFVKAYVLAWKENE